MPCVPGGLGELPPSHRTQGCSHRLCQCSQAAAWVVIFPMEFGPLWRHPWPVSDHTFLVAFLLDKGKSEHPDGE